MKSQLHWQSPQALVSQPQRQSFSIWSKVKDTWKFVVAYLSTSSEPYVWQSQDASGLPQWKAYDPLTHRTVEYSSEADMRAWLEERHYQYHR